MDTVVISPASYLLSKDPIVIPTISKAIKKGGTAALLKGIAPVAVKGISVLSKQTKAPFTTKLPDFKDWRVFSVQSANPLKANLKKLDNFLSYFRSLGKQTAAQGKITRDAELMIKGKSRAIDKYLDSIEKKTYDMVKGFAVKYDKKNTPEMMQEYYKLWNQTNKANDFIVPGYDIGVVPKVENIEALRKTSSYLKDEWFRRGCIV